MWKHDTLQRLLLLMYGQKPKQTQTTIHQTNQFHFSAWAASPGIIPFVTAPSLIKQMSAAVGVCGGVCSVSCGRELTLATY
jgi:hypothetical protein